MVNLVEMHDLFVGKPWFKARQGETIFFDKKTFKTFLFAEPLSFLEIPA